MRDGRAAAFPEELLTGRLFARRLLPSDLDQLTSMHADPAVMATLGGMRTREETVGFLDRLLEHWRTHGFGLWLLQSREGGEFVGRGGLLTVEVDARVEVELAYALTPRWWGRGLATELAVASVRLAFEVLELPSLICMTLPTNDASRRVMHKAGFCYEKDVVHRGLDHVLCRISRERWAGLSREPPYRDQPASLVPKA